MINGPKRRRRTNCRVFINTRPKEPVSGDLIILFGVLSRVCIWGGDVAYRKILPPLGYDKCEYREEDIFWLPDAPILDDVLTRLANMESDLKSLCTFRHKWLRERKENMLLEERIKMLESLAGLTKEVPFEL